MKEATKIKAVNKFKENKGKRQTSHVFNVSPKQIRRWDLNEENLRAKAAGNTKECSLHKGPKTAEDYFEQELI